MKLTFPNSAGVQLAARLDLPVNRHPHAFALFAHCFTCGHTLTAMHNITRELNLHGIAVLRFDFTGIGESEGDFVDTSFTTNISDLEDAANYLAEHYEAPGLLVGHSLGGAAVLCAANRIPSVKAVVTIAAPFAPDHVSQHFRDKIETIAREGKATVDIGGRPFKIGKQFIDDLEHHRLDDNIQNLDAGLLILHSPQDRTVSIDEAAKLYTAARHPKSFVSLDGADHLLSDGADSHYAGRVIAGWSDRYLPVPEKDPIRSNHGVAVRLGQEGYTTEIMVRQHYLTADEPVKIGGNDYGPGPYELISAGLGACTAMTIQMYARRKKWVIEAVEVHLDHQKDYVQDMQDAGEKKPKIDHFKRVIILKGDLTDEQRQRLLEIADRCPVHRTLHETVQVTTVLQEAEEKAR
ncbi:putative redox protein [Neolewinella xylanilytica]|uniref:Putative redox protein n=1 Tax=Neolewinella xylanilytica TaxID=1514080 RepID=A0A2S6I249_9BACT|nr:bifunctional alpha/beta hydrolase/OsmC family protein [Neolewinella xylanilytica]PPK85244.1 putative redox protein [Neolewinella xylanilytica]